MLASLRKHRLTMAVALVSAALVATPATAAKFFTKKQVKKKFWTKAQADSRYPQGVELATSDGNPPNQGSNLVHWNNLAGVPAGFADGVDDAGEAADPAWLLAGNAGTDPATQFVGTTDNVALSFRVNEEPALRLEPDATSPNVIGGFSGNTVSTSGATIGGGGQDGSINQVTDDFGSVGGGRGNRAGDDAGTSTDAVDATVGGGLDNTASGLQATVGGGFANIGSGEQATVGGGAVNTASAELTTVGGGWRNLVTANYGTISGGAPSDTNDALNTRNIVTDEYGTVGGGGGNFAGDAAGTTTDATFATVGGGRNNAASGEVATVGGGDENWASNLQATVGGGRVNVAGGESATVGGGEGNTATGGSAVIGGGQNNTASGDLATVAGGQDNIAADSHATVGGGLDNTASGNSATVAGGNQSVASGSDSAVGGGSLHTASGDHATVAGGFGNDATASDATVGGGLVNVAGGESATVGGGRDNRVTARFGTIGGGAPSNPIDPANTRNIVTDEYGTVGGGGNNEAGNDTGTTTDATYATVGGGQGNLATNIHATIGGGEANSASGFQATVGGGAVNVASGTRSTVPGGLLNAAVGDHGFAAGRRAKANHHGTFVWADSTDADMASTGTNQFIVRAGGDLFLTSNSTLPEDQGFINTSAGAMMDGTDGAYLSDAGVWTDVSSVESKENFAPVDGQEILGRVAALPVTAWSYRVDDPSVRHIGPTAEDFHAAFGVGEDPQHLASLDTGGVALAAIQGLNRKVETLEDRLAGNAGAGTVPVDGVWEGLALLALALGIGLVGRRTRSPVGSGWASG